MSLMDRCLEPKQSIGVCRSGPQPHCVAYDHHSRTSGVLDKRCLGIVERHWQIYGEKHDRKSDLSTDLQQATQSVKLTENLMPKSNGGLKLSRRRQPSRYENYGSISASHSGGGISHRVCRACRAECETLDRT